MQDPRGRSVTIGDQVAAIGDQVELSQPGGTTVFLTHLETLRLIVGYLGISLAPLVVLIPAALWYLGLQADPPVLQTSISRYYYTASRDSFVGILFIAGVFLVAYPGYQKPSDCLFKLGGYRFGDKAITSIAGLGAFITALAPTDHVRDWVKTLHFLGATTLLLAFAVMSIWLFTRGTSDYSKSYNWVYRTCGGVMFFAVVAIAAYLKLPALKQSLPEHSVLILEALGLTAFGISWLTKGRALRHALGLWRAMRLRARGAGA